MKTLDNYIQGLNRTGLDLLFSLADADFESLRRALINQLTKVSTFKDIDALAVRILAISEMRDEMDPEKLREAVFMPVDYCTKCGYVAYERDFEVEHIRVINHYGLLCPHCGSTAVEAAQGGEF